MSSSLVRRSASHADNVGSNPTTDATRTRARLSGTELSATNRNVGVRLLTGAQSSSARSAGRRHIPPKDDEIGSTPIERAVRGRRGRRLGLISQVRVVRLHGPQPCRSSSVAERRFHTARQQGFESLLRYHAAPTTRSSILAPERRARGVWNLTGGARTGHLLAAWSARAHAPRMLFALVRGYAN